MSTRLSLKTWLAAGLLLVPFTARAQDSASTKPSLNIYGFVQTDAISDFKTVNPDWYDMLRPTQLPEFKNEFGKDGNFWASVRQTRFGIKGTTPTAMGDLFARFEFDLLGVGPLAGQTAFRVRYAYGQLGQFAIGQLESTFEDLDVYPNSIEAWGPDGMVFFRNIQVRWTAIDDKESRLRIALERPGASGDAGGYSNRVELSDVSPRFPVPDLTAQYRLKRPWGYVQIAGILGYLSWDDLRGDTVNFSGNATRWGVNLSSTIDVRKGDQIKAQVVYGDGMENYMNDAPIDVGVKTNFSNPTKPLLGVALPVLGIVAYYDHTWNDHATSSIGYSQVHIYNSNGQLPSDFKLGQYATANVLWYPVKDLMLGVEAQWGERQNFSDGWTANDFRLQFSAKYSYGMLFGGGK
jgi:hypothetical protein